MYSVIQEIEKLREDHYCRINDHLSNRYTIQCQDAYGTKRAYCFSVPIRNVKTNNIVSLEFHHNKQGSTFTGSEANVSVSDRIRFLNEYGRCDIIIQGALYQRTNEAIFFTSDNYTVEIRPTLNGVVLLFSCIKEIDSANITLHFDGLFGSIRTNNKYFSVMREKFIPFITVSCIGAMSSSGKIERACEVYNRKVNDSEYVLIFVNTSKSHNRFAVEINMHEPKLFQDTTVESVHPTTNNAFGGISFLGKSKMFGEQWLYSRLDVFGLSQLHGKRIIKSILHIPQLGNNTCPITVNKIAERFCSFGSNWENKIPIKDTITTSYASNGYYHLDLTKLFGNFSKKSVNFVIRGDSSDKPVIIATGDSFYAPQILEVIYQ